MIGILILRPSCCIRNLLKISIVSSSFTLFFFPSSFTLNVSTFIMEKKKKNPKTWELVSDGADLTLSSAI